MRTGDEATAEALGTDSAAALQQLRDGVMSVLRLELRDRSLAEDLCNETFRVVIERLKRKPLDDPGRIAAYLAQTARQLALAERHRVERQRTDTGEQTAIDRTASPSGDPGHAWLRNFRAEAVRRVLLELRMPRDREVLVRLYLYEQDREQICRDLGISEAHFRRVLHRAHNRFRQLMTRRHRLGDLYCLALA